MHELQGEIFHEETGTNSSGESLAPEDGPEERNRDNGEEGAGQHGLDGRTGSLESCQGGEIETRGRELKVNSVEDGLRWKAWS